MAEIIRVTVGKRKRIVADGRDDTLYYEVEAHYQPGELPMDSEDPTKNAGVMMALTSLSVLIDDTVDSEVGTPVVKKMNGKFPVKMATPKQLNYIADLATDPGKDEVVTEWLKTANLGDVAALTTEQADQLIKYLRGLL